MHIKKFKPHDIERMNEFISSVELVDNRVELHDGWIYVFYKPNLTPEEMEAKKLKERIREAEESLVEARLHKGFLDVTDIGDPEKIEEAKKKNDMETKNIEARLNLYKSWEILKN